MRKNRSAKSDIDLTNGPGKVIIALKIDKKLNGLLVTSKSNKIIIVKNKMKFEIGSSKRIGVNQDLDKELMFFIKGNSSVSR